MKDIRQSQKYADYLSQTGWEVERFKGVNHFIKKIPLFGSFIKIQRPEKLRAADIKIIIKKYRGFQVVIEPTNEKDEKLIIKQGFRQSRSPFLPSRTICIDLRKSKEELLLGFKKDCRGAIRKNEKTKFEKIQSIKKFRDCWKKSVGLKRYVPSLSQLLVLKKSFGEDALFLNKNDSGAIFLKAGEIAYYWQAFTGKRGRKKQIQYKVVWEGILWAKGIGAKIFDLEGIFDERFPNKDWRGFTHFKKSFGGHEVEYPGAYTKIVFLFSK